MRKGRGEITKLGDLFEKYKNTLKAPQGTIIDCFCEVAEDVVGVPVAKKNVSYSVFTRTLSVRVSGPLKSEIKLHKREILNHMKGRLGEQSSPTEIL